MTASLLLAKPKPAPAPATKKTTVRQLRKRLLRHSEKAAAKALADKAIRDQIESDRAAQLARDQKLLSEENKRR
jgi:uncharacterized protein YaiL (DUF2058 family)